MKVHVGEPWHEVAAPALHPHRAHVAPDRLPHLPPVFGCQVLDPAVFAHMAGGAGRDVAVRNNLAAFEGLDAAEVFRTSQATLIAGDGPGFKHLAWIRPRAKTGVVFLTNGDRGQALYSRVLRRVLGEDPATLYWL